MTNPDELNALADRCERESPSWELSVAIELAVTPGSARAPSSLSCAVWLESEKKLYNPPPYTTCLDYHIRPEGDDVFWRSGHDGEGPDPSLFKAEVLVVRDNGSRSSFGLARTEPMARRAAELRARSALAHNIGDA